MKNRVNIALRRAKMRNSRSLKRKGKKYCERLLSAQSTRYMSASIVTGEQLNIAQKNATIVCAPSKFSITNNHDATISVFNSVTRLIGEHKYVLFDVSTARSIDLETVCFLSAFMLDSRNDTAYLLVKVPKKKSSDAGRVLFDTHFKEMVDRRIPYFKHGSFLSMTDNRLNHMLIEEELRKTVDFFGDGKETMMRLRSLNAILVELVDNVVSHAGARQQKAVPWILNTMEIVEEDGTLKKHYCLIDLGMGIYESIRGRTEQFAQSNRAFRKVVSDLRQRTQSSFFIENIPLGIQSTTGEKCRGKGIKYVYEMANSNSIYTEFKIITNKVKLDLLNLRGSSGDMLEDFCGTIYTWQIVMKK